MWWFGRRKRKTPKGVAANEAVTILKAAYGGSQADFVTEQLEQVSDYAKRMEIGEKFSLFVDNIPSGIASPHEVMSELMRRAEGCGLACKMVSDKEVRFVRIR